MEITEKCTTAYCTEQNHAKYMENTANLTQAITENSEIEWLGMSTTCCVLLGPNKGKRGDKQINNTKYTLDTE